MATAVSFSPCTPGVVTDSTDMSIPAESMAASRSSPKSLRRRSMSEKIASLLVGFATRPCCSSSGVVKCSSSAILRVTDAALSSMAGNPASPTAAPNFINWRRRTPRGVELAQAFMRLPPPGVLCLSIHRSIRDVARGDVALERRPVTLLRIAVAAAAWRAERNSVALVDHVLLLGIGLHAVDQKFAGRAVLAALDAEGGKDGSFGEEGDGDRRLAAAFDQDLLAKPAAMATRAARVGSKLLVMETQWRDVLADLDRGRAHVGRPRETGDTVPLRVAAHAAVVEKHVGVGLAVANTRLVHAPHRRAATRHHALRHDLAQAAEHQHGHVVADQHARAARRGELRIDDAARRRLERDRLPRAFVVGQVGAGADLDPVHRHGVGVAKRAVDGAVDLGIGAGEIHEDLVALDGELELQGDRRLHDAVGLDLAPVGAVGQLADRGTHRRLAAPLDL